ncbi:hypothetical protein HHI36_016786 [Cryptolaemus montrouzieri]|uniref:Uncharacterized protein n=1 Tax=Cryptolaemus montrouzieri TaxID=559131 RepID=A0ABD2NKQ9_9CUCU
MHDNIDDGDDDNVLTLRQFPESLEEIELQLPNHERCAANTLHLIASKDMDKVKSQKVRKIKHEDEKNSQVQHTDTDKKERTEFYYMFDNFNTTTIDLETLQYLKDEDYTLESWFPNVKKLFLEYNTCLLSSAPVE